MNPDLPDRSTLASALITEAVRLVEDAGPLDDAQAMREAAHAAPMLAARVALRAARLGERLGLPEQLARVRRWAPWVALALAGAVAAAGLSLAGDVTGERRINLMVALASLLGLHLLMLLLWLASFVVAPSHGGALSFGAVWGLLTARVAGGRHGQASLLLQSLTSLLNRARLLPWATGLVSHCIWSLSFVVVLLALLFALAFRRYTLSWETTLLEPGFFVQWVHWLGLLPALIGFAVPDPANVLASTATDADQRAWALWLTGCVVVYGLLPRVLLALGCALVVRQRWQRLQPDLAAPYYRRLAARFDELAPAQIIDRDPGAVAAGPPQALPVAQSTGGVLVAGFELPPEFPWSNAGLPDTALRIEGSARERQQLVDSAARLHPRVLLLVCVAGATPDRGTERLLRELLPHCGACRLWLWSPASAPAPGSGAARWRRWLDDAGLHDVRTFTELAPALAEAT